jgi:hypothetical protein
MKLLVEHEPVAALGEVAGRFGILARALQYFGPAAKNGAGLERRFSALDL